MKIGWWDHFEQIRGVSLAEQYDERLELLRFADASGFYGYHVAEHHLTPLDMAPSPLVFLAAASRATTSIRLGTLVLVLPLYNPARLLQDIYMLDNLSHGRLMPGVGRGVRDVEHEWFGHTADDARTRFAECLSFLRSALSTDVAHLDGADVPTNFTTVQKPMRFWYAGNMKSAADGAMNVIGVGRREDYDTYAETWAARRDAGDADFQGAEPIAGSTRRVLIADTDAEAEAIAARAWSAHHVNFGATSLRVGGRPGPVDFTSVPVERSGAVYGSVETVRERLLALADQLGPNHTYFAPSFQWGDMTHDEARRSMERFVAEVMPALQPEGSRVAAPAGGGS